MKKLLTPFAFAALLPIAACGRGEREPVIIEEPVVEQPAPAPAVIETMPLAPDTTVHLDSLAPAAGETTTAPADSV